MPDSLPLRGRITPAALSWPNTALLRVGNRVFNPCLIEAADFHDDGEVTLYFAGDQQLFRGEQAAFVRWFLTQHSSTGEVHIEAAAPAPAKADVWLPEPGEGRFTYPDGCPRPELPKIKCLECLDGGRYPTDELLRPPCPKCGVNDYGRGGTAVPIADYNPYANRPDPMAADPYAAWEAPAERVVAEAVTDGFEEFEQERKHVGPVS